MDPNQLFFDSRHLGQCVYCGAAFDADRGRAETRDHVPGKVFLDKPYPTNLAIVSACEECNASMSADEEYLACLLECVVCGSTDPDRFERVRIARKLRTQPRLLERIRAAAIHGEVAAWTPEPERVQTVLLRLAQGHIAYELATPSLKPPSHLWWTPIQQMSPEATRAFYDPPAITVWPEIGSRRFIKMGREWPTTSSGWAEVQPARYAYLLHYGEGVSVRILLRGYLACEIRWD